VSQEKKKELPDWTDFVHSHKGFIGDRSRVIINQVPKAISFFRRIYWVARSTVSQEKKKELPDRTDFVQSHKGFVGDLSRVIINQVQQTISFFPRVYCVARSTVSQEKKKELPDWTDFVHSHKGFIGERSRVIINQVPMTISFFRRI
jgi:alkyl sulfatase BDS1-like metallo-beta-lactamase superfamily hydrolase